MKELKGKKVFSIETHEHLYYHNTTSIDITFYDGSYLSISAGDHKLRINSGKKDPPKEKILPWRENEKKFLGKLSDEDKKRYLEARKAFFWLIENIAKVHKHYYFFDKTWRENRSQFSIQIDKEENDPEGILTIFLSSAVAPECDDWFVLGKKRDWKRIIEMYNEVNK
jgi:hypothetical protein